MNSTEIAIEFLLLKLADEDKVFARFFQQEEKSIKECCNYIASEVKKMNTNLIDEKTMLDLARKYYQTDDIKVPKISYRTAIATDNKEVQKSVQEIKINKEVIKSSPVVKKVTSNQKKSNQMSIFDIL